MSELEMEIGRTLGASSFFIYQTIKHMAKVSVVDLEAETGLTHKSIKIHIKNLLECGIITRERVFLRHCNGYIYTAVKETETWKFH